MLFVVLCSFTSMGQNIAEAAKWDKGILKLPLKGVHIKADSLNEAWQRISDQSGCRTILFSSYAQRPYQKVKFVFDSEKCTLAEVIEAFEKTYKDYTHTQDEKTGVIWIHTQAIPYESILTNKVKVEIDVKALPMQTGILERFKPLKIYGGGSGGTAMLNTFDFPVDLGAGTYSVRDILNLGCLANPNRTFLVYLGYNEMYMVTPLTVIILNLNRHALTPGGLFYWQSKLDSNAQALPSEEQVINVLASKDAKKRVAARNYVDLNLSTFFSKMRDLEEKADTWQKAVWVSLATLNLVANAEENEPLHLPETDRMEKMLKEKDWSDDLGLKALVSMELARLEKDSTYLKQAASQSLSTNDIASVQPDMIQILRYSEFVRTNLLALNPSWGGFARAEIEALGNTNLVSIPTAP